MATQSRLEDPALAPAAEAAADHYQVGLRELLEREPYAVEFFQAVRLLERLFPFRAPVGRLDSRPAEEVARFSANTDVAFPASEIQALELRPDTPARMTVNFMGLIGPLGVLPLSYSMLVLERARARDYAMRDFLDIFHHRIISLFYRAWEKYRFTVAYERDQRDRVTDHLHDLVGLGTDGLRDRLAVPDEALLFYVGLLALRTRPAVALEQLLEDYFGVPVEVQQFIGGWYALDVDTQCRLGDEERSSDQLGLGAVVGDEIWDQQSRVRIRLGPMTRRQYDQFLPNGSAYEPLRSLTRFFSGEQFDFEVQLVLARDEVPGCVLGADGDSVPPLGWCTWLRSAPLARDPDETILSLQQTGAHP